MSERVPRLGRGLAALMGDAQSSGTALAPQTVAIDLLEPNPFQPRRAIEPEALRELAESIASNGILQPLLARPHPTLAGRFQLVAGERRWRAAQVAGLHEVPILARSMTDAESMTAALVENLQRQDLNAIEEAEGLRRLLDEFGMTQDRLGTVVGKSRSHVANTLRLLNLPRAVRDQVSAGLLSAGHARALLGHPDPEAAAAAVIARGLNVRQAEALASERIPSSPRADKRMSLETSALARELSERLGLRVEISFNGTGGTLKFLFANLEQLDGLVALING